MVATCRTLAETMPPLAATAADRVGSSALEKVFSSSTVSWPRPIMVFTLPAAARVMASAPAMVTKCALPPAASMHSSVRAHSTAAASSTTPPPMLCRTASST